MTRKPKKYTMQDLADVHVQFEENWKKLVGTVDLPAEMREEYVKEEARLDKKEKEIKKYLKMIVSSPCLVLTSKDCSECSGYWKWITKKQKSESGKMIDVDVKVETTDPEEWFDRRKCATLFKYSMNGTKRNGVSKNKGGGVPNVL